MKAIEIIKEIRRDILDDPDKGNPDDNLWDDPFLLSALNQAEREIARRTLCLTDSTTASLAVVTASPGWNALDARILFVEDMAVDGTRVFWANEYNLRNNTSSAYEDLLGTPEKFVLNGNRFRIVPDILAATAVVMNVNRLPLADMEQDDTPEIPEDYVPAMGHYVAYRALLKNDSEAFDRAKALEHLGIFTSMVGPALSLRELHDRKNRKPKSYNMRDSGGLG